MSDQQPAAPRHFLRSPVVVLGIIAVLLLDFALGTFVGFTKARFSFNWEENYHRNFGGPPPEGFSRDFRGQNLIAPHGTSGSIMKVDGMTLVIRGQDGVEKTVAVSDDTLIRKGRETLNLTDLHVDDQVVIIGAPDDDGGIAAKFIRVFP